MREENAEGGTAMVMGAAEVMLPSCVLHSVAFVRGLRMLMVARLMRSGTPSERGQTVMEPIGASKAAEKFTHG